MSKNTPTPADDVVEALGKVLDIIDESYRKYGYDWDGEETRAFQRARDLHQAALAAKPDQPVVDGLAEECRQLIAGGLNTTDKEWADWTKKNQTAILTALSSNADAGLLREVATVWRDRQSPDLLARIDAHMEGRG